MTPVHHALVFKFQRQVTAGLRFFFGTPCITSKISTEQRDIDKEKVALCARI